MMNASFVNKETNSGIKCMSIIKTCGNISEWYWYNLNMGNQSNGRVNKEVVLKSTPQTTAP
jgi:hypothetical protein